jgi:hypothetical protein
MSDSAGDAIAVEGCQAGLGRVGIKTILSAIHNHDTLTGWATKTPEEISCIGKSDSINQHGVIKCTGSQSSQPS